jgi:histidinol phosphatase-like PHP family hydrolase
LIILKYSMLAMPFSLLPVFLYAETHFRFFPFFPSLLFKREPEVVFDVPARLDPGKDLPVVLIVNDLHRFPVELLDVTVVVSQKALPPRAYSFPDVNKYRIRHPLEGSCGAYVFFIKRDCLVPGRTFINCKARLSRKKNRYQVLNDNFFSSSKLPFSCFVSSEPLPGSDFCSYGDLHVHSQYSQSHVEFGPPIIIIDLISKSCGLDFLAITDHSYDLSCSMDDYLKNDKELRRWNSFSNELTSYRGYNCIIIKGEEISCFNSRNKAVHLCALGINEYIPGSVDGARNSPFLKNSTLTLEEVIHLIHTQQGLAIAAHPGAKFGFLQKLLLGRGTWQSKDVQTDLDGFQAVNNGFEKSWITSKHLWIKELLNGKKLPLIAGNDSHGDFNRYRCIAIPFISISENFNRYLSYAKTGTYTKVKIQSDVISEIKKGSTFVTTGPFLALSGSDSISDNLVGNEKDYGKNEEITAIIKSSYEFGSPLCLKIFYGQHEKTSESTFFSISYNEKKYNIFQKIPLTGLQGTGYLRAELTCVTEEGKTSFAATSPCYLSKYAT